MSKTGRNSPCPCGSGKKYKRCHDIGGHLTVIDLPEHIHPDKVQAIHRDDKNKVNFIFTNDILINQLVRDTPPIASSFDELSKPTLQKASALIAEAIGIIMPQIIKYSLNDQGVQPTCGRLLNSAIETHTASIHIARGGYRKQYGMLARSVIETLAVVLHLHSDSTMLKPFHEGKLDAPKSITVAKKILPPFGQQYGHLSKLFVHTGGFHAAFEPLAKYEKGEDALNYILANIRINSWLVYVVSELVFYPFVANPKYWQYEGQNEKGKFFCFNPSATEKAWMRSFLEGDELLEK